MTDQQNSGACNNLQFFFVKAHFYSSFISFSFVSFIFMHIMLAYHIKTQWNILRFVMCRRSRGRNTCPGYFDIQANKICIFYILTRDATVSKNLDPRKPFFLLLMFGKAYKVWSDAYMTNKIKCLNKTVIPFYHQLRKAFSVTVGCSAMSGYNIADRCLKNK